MHKCAYIFIGSGAIALALSLVMGWLGFHHVIRNHIKKNAKLEPGGQLYEMWSNSKVPMYLKFHMFNVTNPDEIVAGGKPKVVELGPYTYLEKKLKYDIGPGSLNDTIQYHRQVWYYFSPELSKGKEDDLITFINVPFVSTAKMITLLTSETKIHETVNDKLGQLGEKLFKTAPLRQLLFHGISLEPYIQLFQGFEGNVKIPKSFEGGKFAFYLGKNGSDEGFYEIETGGSVNKSIHQWKQVGQIRRWNNQTSLPWWKSECKQINGTDGSIYAPGVTQETELRSFSPELCRSITAVFDQPIEFKALQIYRFTTSKAVAAGIKTNPKNACYCSETQKPELCERDGLIMMSGCSNGSPIAMSAPHFYGGQPSLAFAIDGLNPNEEAHKTFLDIEPWTGVVLRAAKRLQMNIDLQQYESMGSFSKVQNVAFPILWVEESAEIPDDSLTTFQQLYLLLGIIDIAKYVMIAISGSIVVIGVFIALCKTDKEELLVVK